MADVLYFPIVIGAVLTPNPARAGGAVLVSVAAADLETFPADAVRPCGLFPCGEV